MVRKKKFLLEAKKESQQGSSDLQKRQKNL